LVHREFRAGEISTGFIAEHESLLTNFGPMREQLHDAVGSAILSTTARKYPAADGFRLNANSKLRVFADVGEGTQSFVTSFALEDSFIQTFPVSDGLVLFEKGQPLHAVTSVHGTGHASAADGAIIAPMPGKVIAVDVAEGDAVTAGQRLMVLEAMKMEHALTAPFDGNVTGLSVEQGSQVQVEAVLCVVEPGAAEPAE
jgi:3-methylcrotonyl-CoA carboxylase alpha subunit